MWPINLVRDLPVRSKRIAQSAYVAGQGLLFLVPEGIDSLRYGETRRWLRTKLGRSIFWTHGLLAQLFDLVGGPELLQLLLRPWANASTLSSAEIASISSVLGPDALRFGEIRVMQGGLFKLVFRLNGNLAFATWHTVWLPTEGQHTRASREILVHELTHVYQYERVGSRYLGEAIYMLIRTQRDCYNYGGPDGLTRACTMGGRYCDYNREQQAMIAQDFFARKSSGFDVVAYEPFIRELRAGFL